MIWLTIILVLVALIAGAIKIEGKGKDDETANVAGWVCVTAIVFALINGFFACTTKIEQRHYGIEVSYGGKATGRETGAGLQWHNPFNHFDSWDATRQTFNTLGNSCEKVGDGSMWVTIAGQGNACIRVQIEWQATNKERASENWSAYKPVEDKTRFEVFYERRVSPQMFDAVQDTFRAFNPMTAVDKNGEAVAPDINAYKKPLTNALTERLGNDLEIISVSFGTVGYDEATRNSIAAYGQKVRENRNLKVDEQNAALRRSIATDSGLKPFERECLELVKATGKGEPGFCTGQGLPQVTRPVS